MDAIRARALCEQILRDVEVASCDFASEDRPFREWSAAQKLAHREKIAEGAKELAEGVLALLKERGK